MKEFEIQLNYSSNILDGDTENSTAIVDAQVRVSLESNNGELYFVHVGDGKYVTPSSTKPLENEIYNLEVKVPGYAIISASSRVPTQAIVENLSANTVISQSGVEVLKVDFDILDAEDIDNYYIWEVSTEDPFAGNIADLDYILSNIQTTGPTESVQDDGRWSKLFVQEMDINQSLGFILSQNDVSDSSDGDDPVKEEMYLKVISASSDYYEYLLSLELHEKNPGSSNFSIPVELHTNIRGGLGIFAGFNAQAQIIPSE